MKTNLGIIYISFFGMRFYGVTPALVPPVKHVSNVATDKQNMSLWCMCTYISFGAGGSDSLIMLGTFIYILS